MGDVCGINHESCHVRRTLPGLIYNKATQAVLDIIYAKRIYLKRFKLEIRHL
jgi:hypothetical protein